MKSQYYLLHNTGVEVNIVAGPFVSTELEKRMIKFMQSEDFHDEDEDTLHLLEIKGNKPSITDFSGGYMDELRKKAGLTD